VSRLDDPDVLRREYETEHRLVRRSLYDAAIYEGLDPREHALLALFEARPRRVLDAGCGTGEFAERVARVLGVDVVGVDQSERMVELTRARGLEAHVADVRQLPFEDGELDAVSANWMLYHVADLDRALGEAARVLRPGGRLVAITNSMRHLEEIWGVDEAFGFSAENGARALERHFARVERRDVGGGATFVTRENLRGYLAAFERLHGRDETERLAALDVPLRATCRNAVFVADKAP
jgi:SAM-dependent methyltransferase